MLGFAVGGSWDCSWWGALAGQLGGFWGYVPGGMCGAMRICGLSSTASSRARSRSRSRSRSTSTSRSRSFNRVSPCGTDVYSPVPGAPDFLCVAKERSAKKGDPTPLRYTGPVGQRPKRTFYVLRFAAAAPRARPSVGARKLRGLLPSGAQGCLLVCLVFDCQVILRRSSPPYTPFLANSGFSWFFCLYRHLKLRCPGCLMQKCF